MYASTNPFIREIARAIATALINKPDAVNHLALIDEWHDDKTTGQTIISQKINDINAPEYLQQMAKLCTVLGIDIDGYLNGPVPYILTSPKVVELTGGYKVSFGFGTEKQLMFIIG